MKLSARSNNCTKALLFVLCFTAAFVPTMIRTREQQVAPWDEMYHLSYIQYIYEGHVPKPGDSLNTWSREVFSCRSVYPFGPTTGVPCGEIGDPFNYPEGGTNTAALWPPIYYSVSAGLIRVQSLFMSDPFLAARQANAFIWSIGVASLAIAVQRLSKYRSLAVVPIAVLVSLPAAYFRAAFISPHALVPFLLSLALFAFTKRKHGGFSDVIWFPVAIMTAFSVPHAISGFAAIAAAATLRTVFSKQGDFSAERLRLTSRGAVFPVLATLTGLTSWKLWDAIQARRFTGWAEGVNTELAQQGGSNPFSFESLVSATWRFIPHTLDFAQFSSIEATVASQAWALFVVAGLGAALFSAREQADLDLALLAVTTVAVGILFSMYVENAMDVPVPPRYGLSIVILGLLVSTASVRNRFVAHGLISTAGLTLLLGFTFQTFVP